MHYSRAKPSAAKNYIIKFINCTWEQNKAVFGSAVEASVHASDTLTSGYVMSPIFKDCQFISNFRLEEEYDCINDSHELLTRFSWGKGVFFATALPIQFKGNTTFFGSNTSALAVSASIIEFAAGSNVNFTNNTAFEGGAINLLGLSEIHVKDNSTFLFHNNTAIFKGGAIAHRSGNKLDFVSSRRCFIQYVGDTTVVSERSITIEFKNNSALPHGDCRKSYGQAIYATTLIPCVRTCMKHGQHNTDIPFDCIGDVIFWNRSYRNAVSTDGAIFSLSNENNMLTAIPGKEFELMFKLLDENGKEAYGSYHVTVWPKMRSDQTSVKLDPTYSYIHDKTIKLYGEPGHKARIVIGANSFRDIAMGLEVEMEEYPPGFVTHNHASNHKGVECVCFANRVDKTYLGILRCELNSSCYDPT